MIHPGDGIHLAITLSEENFVTTFARVVSGVQIESDTLPMPPFTTMRFLRILLIVLALVVALPASAQDAPTFFIERIEVRDLERVRPAIIVSESRLHDGRNYSEDELRRASDRIKRLPFVLDARFALEKGSVRDSYVLVISVNETRPFFYLLDVEPYFRKDDDLALDDETTAAIGGRVFAGTRGVFHAGLIDRGDEFSSSQVTDVVQFGYTHHGLFRGRGFATITANRAIGGSASIVPGLLVGTALTPNQTVSFEYTEADSSYLRQLNGRVLEARWVYDTTDHPFFPTAGKVLSFAPLFIENEVEFSGPGEPPATLKMNTRGHGLRVQIARYLPVTPRDTVSFELEGGALAQKSDRGGVVTRRDEGYLDGVAKFSHILHERSSGPESRLELSIRRDSRLNSIFLESAVTDRLSLSWVRRDAWGTVRLGLGYAW